MSIALALVIAAGCGGGARSAAADNGHRRYHDGQRWIDVEVALDRFAADSASAPGAQSDGHARAVVVLAEPVAFVADLDVSAQDHRQKHPELTQVYACLYAPGADRAKTSPMHLTHRLTLTGAPGQDLAALAAKHGARVVEKVDYLSNAVICEATGPSLLAALDAANALRDEPGVIAATPLIARQHAARDRR
jgi:hypothetical protein